MNIVNNDRMTRVISVALAVVFGVLCASLVVDAATTVSGTTITLENGETITNSTNAVIKLGGASDSVQVLGTASTSALKVGDETTATINGLTFGYCTIAAIDVTAATTTYALCLEPSGSATVVSGDKVFVQATSSLPVATVITAASSTATTGTLNLRFHATMGASAIAANTVSVWFWAVR